jgi:hypothetical protein
VDELYDGGQVVPLRTAVTQGSAGQQQQGRTQSLAASIDDVARHLAHQWNAGVQPGPDHAVHLPHLVGDQG